jgi:hypothetical protein
MNGVLPEAVADFQAGPTASSSSFLFVKARKFLSQYGKRDKPNDATADPPAAWVKALVSKAGGFVGNPPAIGFVPCACTLTMKASPITAIKFLMLFLFLFAVS